jgi:hypothetical protein
LRHLVCCLCLNPRISQCLFGRLYEKIILFSRTRYISNQNLKLCYDLYHHFSTYSCIDFYPSLSFI